MPTAGIDSHKDTLAGCVIDPTGRSIERRTFSNTPAGYRRTQAWLQAHDVGRVQMRGVGQLRAASGVVPDQRRLRGGGSSYPDDRPGQKDPANPQQVRPHRRFGHSPGRSPKGDDLPAPRPQDALEDLRALVFYRRELVESRTAEVNRLHADLTLLCPGYHNLLRSGLLSPKALARAVKLITRDRTTRADIARRRIRRVRRLLRQVRKLDTQITRLVAALGTSLTDIYGIGNT